MIQQFTWFITLRCTQSRSVLSGHRCVQHEMLRTKRELTDSQLGANSDLGLSLDTTDACIVHKQTKRDCVTTKTALTERRRKTKMRRCRDASASGKENLINVVEKKKTGLHFSICACHHNTVLHVSQ